MPTRLNDLDNDFLHDPNGSPEEPSATVAMFVPQNVE
jgi:hypothetical protein